MNPWLMWIASAIGVCVVAVLWRFYRADHDFRGTHTHALTLPPVRPSFEGVGTISVQQQLQEMEQIARQQPETSLTVPASQPRPPADLEHFSSPDA